MKGNTCWCKSFNLSILRAMSDAQDPPLCPFEIGFANSLENSADEPKKFGIRKSKQAHTSFTLFWTGVPVRMSLKRLFSFRAAFAVAVSGFLSR